MAQPIGKGQAGGAIPQQRAQDNSAQTRAISNLGGAIAQTGKLAEQMQAEKERQQLGKAELQFAESEGALRAKLARTPEPSEHEGIARRHFEEAKAKILNDDSYTRKFRNELADRLNMAGATRLNKISTNASLQQVRNGRQINNQRIKNRLADHDYAGAAELINGSVGVYLTPEMAQVQLEEVGMRQEDHAKKQIKDDALDEIAGDPMGWAERNKEPWEGDMAGDWLALQSHAKTVRRNKGYEETDNVLDLIYSDGMNIEQLEQMTPHLRPKARESLRAEHTKRQEYLAEGIRPSSVDQDSLIGTVGDLLSKYEAEDTEDFDDAYVHLDSLIRDIKDPAQKAEYNRQLKAKRSGQWAESKEKRDVAIKVFDDALESSDALVPEAAPYEELSKGSYLEDDFLSNPENLLGAGFSQDQTDEIVEASEKWYGKGQRKGTDPEDLVRRYWNDSNKQDEDFPASKRAVLDAIRHFKTDAYAVPNPTAAARADLVERERKVENTRIKGQLRQKFMKYLERHPDATPEEIQQKAHGLGVEFTTESIKSKMLQKQGDRPTASVGTGDAFRVASSYLGVRELADAKSNPQIDKWISMNGRYDDVATDSTAWCSAFVNGVADEAGLETSGKLNAKSWLGVGDEIPAAQAQQGDVVVFWRDNKSSWKGHVGFFQGYDKKGNVRVLGGNQGNEVSIKTYPASRLLGVRRLKALNS